MNTKVATTLILSLAGLGSFAPALDAQQLRGASGDRMGSPAQLMRGAGMATVDPVARVLDHAERLELTLEQVERLTRFHVGYVERTAAATATLEAHREAIRQTRQEAMREAMEERIEERIRERRERLEDPESRPDPDVVRQRMRRRMQEPPPPGMRASMRERMGEVEVPPEIQEARQLLHEARRGAMAELESTLTVEQMRQLRRARPGSRGRAPLPGPRR